MVSTQHSVRAPDTNLLDASRMQSSLVHVIRDHVCNGSVLQLCFLDVLSGGSWAKGG